MASFKGTEENLGMLQDSIVDQMVQPFSNNNYGVFTEKDPAINVLCVLVHLNFSINQ